MYLINSSKNVQQEFQNIFLDSCRKSINEIFVLVREHSLSINSFPRNSVNKISVKAQETMFPYFVSLQLVLWRRKISTLVIGWIFRFLFIAIVSLFPFFFFWNLNADNFISWQLSPFPTWNRLEEMYIVLSGKLLSSILFHYKFHQHVVLDEL